MGNLGIPSGGSNNPFLKPNETWVLGDRSVSGSIFYIVLYGKGKFLAIPNGSTSTIYSIDGGYNWKVNGGLQSRNWSRGCFANNIFVIVCTEITTDNVYYSYDGLSWLQGSTASNGLTTGLNAICGGNGIFVALAMNGTTAKTCITSTDGSNWTNRTVPVGSLEWCDVCFGDGLFVAVADTANANSIMTSPDGITWTSRTSPGSLPWNAIAYGNGKYIAIGDSAKVAVSTDGITWGYGTDLPFATGYRSIRFVNGFFVVINYNNNRVYYSTNGTSWTSLRIGLNNSDSLLAIEICEGGGNTIIMGQQRVWVSTTAIDMTKYSAGNIPSSFFIKGANPPGIEWKLPTTAFQEHLSCGVYAPSLGLYIACTDSGVINVNKRIMTSPDCKTWTARTVTSGSISTTDIAVGYPSGAAPIIVAIGSSASYRTSTDGINWTDRTNLGTTAAKAIVWGADKFVIVGTNCVYTSTDGINWTSRTPSSNLSWVAVTYGNGLYVAVAMSASSTSSIMTSPDGITWTTRTAPSTMSWRNVTFGNGVFVASGTYGDPGSIIMYSTNGIAWSSVSGLPTIGANCSQLAYGGGMFIILIDGLSDAPVVYSFDGKNWFTRNMIAPKIWYFLAYGNGRFFAGSGSYDYMHNIAYSEVDNADFAVDISSLTSSNVNYIY